MAVKSIIEVDVQDEAFQRFQTLFADYEAKVKGLPSDWKKVDDAMGGAAKRFAAASGPTDAILAGMAASAGVIAESIHKASRAQRQFEGATRRSHSTMNALGAAASKVSHTIFGMGKWMLKMGALGGGLAGIGGAIGLDDLAGSALNRQRSARGVGMTPGQAAAFSTYYDQFGNADAVASNVASARNDISKRWAFTGIGIGQSALQNDSNFQLSTDVVSKIQHALKQMPRATWINEAQARGFNAFMSTDEMRVLRHTSNARVEDAKRGAAGSTNALGFSPGVARDWANFSIQLRKAGIEIESSLIVGLHRLAPVLTRISSDAARWISDFAKGPEMGKIVGDVESGLQTFAKFLGSPGFRSDAANFSAAIGQLAHETVNALRYLHLIPQAKIGFAKLAADAAKPNQLTSPFAPIGIAAHRLAGSYSKDRITTLSQAADKRFHLPAGTMERLAMHESSYGKHLIGPETKYGRAVGVWQMLRGTATDMGVGSRISPLEESTGAARYLSRLHAHYGSWNKAVAAYNWGPGNLDADIKAHGAKWLTHAPKATQGEVAAVAGRHIAPNQVTPVAVASANAAHDHLPAKVDRLIETLRRQKPMRPQQVTIRNQTSARVALQTNAAAF